MIMHIKNSVRGGVKCVVFILLAIVLNACSGPTDQQLVLMAKDYLSQSKVREAAIELKSALQENPKNAEARYLLGGINLSLGDAASAEKEFKRAADAGWPEEQAQIGIARAMLVRNARQKLLDEIKVKDSYSASARANLYALHALAQAGLNNLSQADSLLRKAVELDASALHVLESSIIMQLAAENLTGASKIVKQALVTYDSAPEILLLSAQLAISRNDQAAAATAYRKVIALEPHNLVTFYGRRARLGLARLETLEGSLDQAQAALAPLLKRGGNDPEVNFIGGLLAFRQGKLELAEKRLLSVLKVAPDHADTQLLFGTVSYAQNNYEQAAYYIAKYVSIEPGNLGARKLLGQAYSKLGEHEKARAALQSALEDNSGDAELLAQVGLLQLQAGDITSGIRGLEQAVKVAPDNLALKNKLAKAYIFTGETESAIKALNAMIATGGDKKQAQVLLISAHVKAEQYAQAIDVVLGMIKEYPDDPAILSLAGNVFEVSNDRSEARKYFNKALQVSPGYLPAAMLLARLEEFDGRVDKAESMYKKLVQTNKEDTNALMALARLAAAQKRSEDMVNWLKQASKRSPRDVRSRMVLAEYYLREKQLAKADLMLKEALDIVPGDNALLELEARLQMAEGQYNVALSSLNKLITKVPDSVYARTLLAEVYLKLNQLAGARQQLGIVLEKQPYYVSALVLMASLELQSGHFDKALNYAAKVQKIQPDLYMGYELAGDALMNKKDYAAAKTRYEQAWQRKSSAGLVIKLSGASARAGRFVEAAKPLIAWLDDHPDDVRVLQLLGAAHLNLKQNSKAIEAFEKVLKIQPDNVVVLNNLAWLYSLHNDPKALELVERAYKVKPEDSGIQDTYGWVLVQQGQVEKGRRILEQAVNALPGVAEVQYHYAVALLKTGEEAKAKKILGELLRNGEFFEGRDEAEQLLK